MNNETRSKLGSNTTTLDAPPDGLSHNELLLRLERQDAIEALREVRSPSKSNDNISLKLTLNGEVK